MESDVLPEDPAKQWEILLCIIAFEEKNNDRRADGSLINLAYFWNHHGIRHIFGEWLAQMKNKYDCKISTDVSSLKADDISLVWRKRGNIKYKAGSYKDSHQCYTKAVLYADKMGPMYPLAVANRSAASLKLGNNKAALTDVHRALRNGYPIELQHKLFLRRAECLLEMGNSREASEAVKVAVDHNERVGLTGQALADFEHMVNELNERIAASRKTPIPEYNQFPELYLGENPNFRGASVAVDIHVNEEFGRHVVTNKPVKRGDVLFAESPFAAVRLSDKHLPHPKYCDYCCSSDEAVVGCDQCSRAVFCSESCAEVGYAAYHRWECPGVRANIFNVIGISHLALSNLTQHRGNCPGSRKNLTTVFGIPHLAVRVLIQYAHKGFPKLPDCVRAPTTAAELFECYMRVGKVESFKKDLSPFYSMFHLSSNVDVAPVTDNIQYALTATMLTQYLETYTSFFDFFSDKVGFDLPPDELKLLACALIFRTLGQLVINAHTILDINTTQQPTEMSPGDYLDCFCKVGTAIYPAASMMNHSCDPNIINVFYKNQLCVKGNKEIPEGTEVFNSYGPHFAREALHIRKEKLQQQYGFNCACQACSDDSRKDFTSLFVAYACPSCKGPVTWVGGKNSCHQCTNEFPLQRAQTTADTANALHASALRASTPEQQCSLMARAYRLMQQVLYRHHNVLRRTVDDLARLYASNGDYSRAVELIKQNVQSFEYQFGSFSVEVTNEVRKMAHLMLGRIMKYFEDPEADERQPMNIKDWIRETLKIVKKANQLMELNFGTLKPIYANLKSKETMLEELAVAPRVHTSTECINFKLQMMNLI